MPVGLIEDIPFEHMPRPLVNRHEQDVIGAIFKGLDEYSELSVFPDDVSIIMFEHLGKDTD